MLCGLGPRPQRREVDVVTVKLRLVRRPNLTRRLDGLEHQGGNPRRLDAMVSCLFTVPA